ncbi:MAG TPA: NAD(P)H-dependent oxidoreductase subunit E, partial [Lentzea sp.]
MDLRLTARVAATGEERAAVDEVLGPPSSQWEGGARRAEDAHMAFGGHAARGRRHLLITVLHAVQERVGWISPGALDYVAERLTVPPAEAYGVASFYAMFRTTPSPGTARAPGAVVHICDDVACKVAGAESLCAEMTRRFGPEGTDASLNGTGVTWQRSPCLGKCDQGSAALIQQAGAATPRRDLAPVTPDVIWQALTVGESPADVPLGVLVPQLSRSGSSRTDELLSSCPTSGNPVDQDREDEKSSQGVSLLRRLGHVDPASLGSYRAAGGYEMLRRAIALGPQGVIREVRDAKLMGRGGAAFPTHIKWDAVATNPVRPKYVVCNADESEPGTFKDRVLMEADPYALVEALTVMGYACGAEQGYIYIRGEYPTAEGRLQHAIDTARAHGFLGADVMGEGFTFD